MSLKYELDFQMGRNGQVVLRWLFERQADELGLVRRVEVTRHSVANLRVQFVDGIGLCDDAAQPPSSASSALKSTSVSFRISRLARAVPRIILGPGSLQQSLVA